MENRKLILPFLTRHSSHNSNGSSEGKLDKELPINLPSSNKSIPKPPSEKLEISSRYEGNSRQLKISGELRKSRSKSPKLVQSNRISNLSTPRSSIQPTPRSQQLQISKNSFGDKKAIAEIPNPREQIAELIMQIQKKNSMPIAVEKQFQDNKIILKPFESPPDDPSGTTIVTNHGLFEIPKEKNAPSKWVSKKDFIMESYFKDVFSKLPFVMNFNKRKNLAKWLKETRKANFERKREELINNFWASRKFFAKNYQRLKGHLTKIAEIVGVEIKEGNIYGKRHIEFSSRQQACINENGRIFDRESTGISDIVTMNSEELSKIQAKEREDFVDRQITEKLEGKKDTFIGISSKKKNSKDIREENIKLQGKLIDGFLHYVRLSYFNSVIEMIEETSLQFAAKMCGPRKPRFEVIMVIKQNLNVDPELAILKEIILGSIQNFILSIFTNRQIIHTQSVILSSFKLQKPIKMSYNVFINEILEHKGLVKKCHENLEKEIDKDMKASQKTIGNYLHLEQIKTVGEKWVVQLKDKNFDVVSFYKENFEQFNNFSQQIEEISVLSTVSGMISVETATIKAHLQEIPKLVISSLKERLLEIISHESSDLKTEIFSFHKILEDKAASLPQFAEQVNATTSIKETKLQNWEKRLMFINECSNLCRKEKVRIPANTVVAIDEIKSIIKIIPVQIIKAEQHYQEYGNLFEDQMNAGSAKLAKKIKKFEQNYIQRYLQDIDRLDQPDLTLKELTKREEALATMKQRVEMIETFSSALIKLKPKDLTIKQTVCRKKFDALFLLHCDTLKLWKLTNYWRKHLEKWMLTTFENLDVKKMCIKAEKISKRLGDGYFESKKFPKAAERALKLVTEEISSLTSISSLLLDLKSDSLKPRHWEMILKVIKKPELLNFAFKLQDLTEVGLIKYIPKIKNILEDAYEESKCEANLISIKTIWDSMELSFEESKNGSSMHVLANVKEIENWIEEHIITIENIEQAMNTSHIQAEIEDWKVKLTQMKHVLDLWESCQNSWLQLEPMFNSEHMGNTTSSEIEAFKEMQTNLKRLVWAAQQNTKATYNLLLPGRDKLFEKILEGISNLKKNIKGFLDSHRFTFPRFFFLSDPQLLQFLSYVHTEQQFDKYLSFLFPGGSKFLIKKFSYEEAASAEEFEFELSSSDLENKDEIDDFLSDLKADDTQSEGNRNFITAKQKLKEKCMKNVNQGKFLYEIMGIEGFNGEILFFEKSVSIVGSVEAWLLEVEKEMKSTLGNMVKDTVSYFSKQSLDEWILDFPQQTVFTALMLVVTSEITEIMKDYQNQKGSDSSDNEIEIPNEEIDEKFTRSFFTNSQSIDKEALKKELQSKGYKGLYTRLQFWISQIAKSLNSNQSINSYQIMCLRSVIYYLNYQSDIVNSLLLKKIYSKGDFEWKKIFRAYWKPSVNKVELECGETSILQENEYLGSSYRLLYSPLTTRYFVFISSALRELSLVLFKTSPCVDSAFDIFEEFSNLCGIASSKVYINSNTSMTMLLKRLNGAAHSGIWIVFEHLDNLSLHNLQILTKEVQMVRQQFIASNTIKNYNYKFAAMFSISPLQYRQDKALLSCLQLSFRSIEIIKPDVKFIVQILLIQEGFKSIDTLSTLMKNLIKILMEKIDPNISVSVKAIMSIIIIAKKMINQTETDIESREISALANAAKLFFSNKIISANNIGPKITKEKTYEILENIDDTVGMVFRRRQKTGFEMPELRKLIGKSAEEMGLNLSDLQLKKCEDIYYGLRINRGFIILGPNTTGKSTMLELVAKILKNVYNFEINQIEINPNTFTEKQLFGSMEPQQNPKEGILSKICEEALQSDSRFHWLILDAKYMQSWWAELFLPLFENSLTNLNDFQSLDLSDFLPSSKSLLSAKTDILAFPNMTNLQFPKNMSIIYQTTEISSMSPSFLNKVGIYFFEEKSLTSCDICIFSLKSICQKYLKYGLHPKFIIEIFSTKIKKMIENIEVCFSENPGWNSKVLSLSFVRIFQMVMEVMVTQAFVAVGEEEGMYSPSDVELEQYAIKNASTKPILIEYYSRIEIGMIYTLIWSFGACLNSDDKSKFSTIIHKHIANSSFKYKFPENSDIFNIFIDWTDISFHTFSEAPLAQNSLSPSLYIMIPSLELTRSAFLLNSIILVENSLNTQKYIQLIGESGSGKTSLAQYISNINIENYSTTVQTVTPHLSVTHLHSSVLNLVNKKGFDRKLLLVIEDVHLDENYKKNILEDLKYWAKHEGFFEPEDLDFIHIKSADFITTCQPQNLESLSLDSNIHKIFLEAPNTHIFKQILVNCVFQRKNSVEILVHRYLKIIISIICHMKKDFSDNFSFMRVIKNFKSFLYFSKNCEWSEGNELKEEDRVAEMLAYELKRGFKDSIKDKKEFDLKISEHISNKLKVNKMQAGLLYGDYISENQKYNSSFVYSRKLVADIENIQNIIIEKINKYPGMTEKKFLSIVAYCLYPSAIERIWAICRIIQEEGLHGILQIPSGNGAYECVQAACILKQCRIIEIDRDFTDFQAKFEESILTIFEKMKNSEQTQCVFLFQISPSKYESYLDLLNWFIISDLQDISLFSAGFLDKLSNISQDKLFRSKILNSDENPILIVLKFLKKYFHIIIQISSLEEYKTFLLRYPKLSDRCEIIIEYSQPDYGELSHMAENYLKIRGIEDVGLAEVMTELFMHAKGSYERNEFVDASERPDLDNFICTKRLVDFIDNFCNMYYQAQEKIKKYRSNLEKVLEKTKIFQSMHEQLGNNMSFLQEHSMKTSSNINLTRGQIEKLRKSQAQKQELIEEKERLNAALQSELEHLQKENEEIVASKDMRLEQTFNALVPYLQQTSYIQDFFKANDEKNVRLFHILAAIIGKDEEGNLLEIFEQPSSLIGSLRNKHEGQLSRRVLNVLSEYVSKVEKKTYRDPFMMSLYDYLDSILQRNQVLQLLQPQIARTDELKNEIANNNVSITYAQKYILDIERELRRCIDRERLFSSELTKRKEKLKTSEVTHIRTDNLIAAVTELNTKARNKLNIVEEIEKKLVGDCLIFTCNSEYFGHLNIAQRVQEWASIFRNLEAREIFADERWQDSSFSSQLKIFKYYSKFINLEPSKSDVKFGNFSVSDSQNLMKLSSNYWFGHDINLGRAYDEISEILIKNLLPKHYKDLDDRKENMRILKADMKERKKRKKTELTLCDINLLQDYDHYMDLLNVIKASDESIQRFYLAQEDYLSFMQQFPLIINLEKCLKKFIMPQLFLYFYAGIKEEFSSLFSLIYAIYVGLAQGQIKDKELDEFEKKFWNTKENLQMGTIVKEAKPQKLEKSEAETNEISLDYEKNLKEKLNQANSEEVSKMMTVLFNSHYSEIPTLLRILVSLKSPDNKTKNLLKDFINERLNFISDLHDTKMTLENLIKIGNWKLPIAIHSLPGVNIINMLCSLANNHNVGLEVIRKLSHDENKIDSDPATYELIFSSAKEGNWVLISTEQFPFSWKGIYQQLKELNEKNEINEEFRIFFDLQGFKNEEIPWGFLNQECGRIYVIEKDAEEAARYSDIWSRFLCGDEILKIK
ncbi:unnamed protein product [Blepharisma stoltei]|uniref:Dynein heavy chain family protein n=1 Tax=Blepharisma stoltei TaxID=1481888 RepID=A0AAU9JDX5_9CILI|nr:unnamed protein product [Blepharisma stoltei]